MPSAGRGGAVRATMVGAPKGCSLQCAGKEELHLSGDRPVANRTHARLRRHPCSGTVRGSPSTARSAVSSRLSPTPPWCLAPLVGCRRCALGRVVRPVERCNIRPSAGRTRCEKGPARGDGASLSHHRPPAEANAARVRADRSSPALSAHVPHPEARRHLQSVGGAITSRPRPCHRDAMITSSAYASPSITSRVGGCTGSRLRKPARRFCDTSPRSFNTRGRIVARRADTDYARRFRCKTPGARNRTRQCCSVQPYSRRADLSPA